MARKSKLQVLLAIVIIMISIPLILSIIFSIRYGNRVTEVRPVKIHVIDADTGKPISNMKVDYNIYDFHYINPTILACINNFNGCMETIIKTSHRFSATKYTDINGDVSFSKVSVPMKRRDYSVEELYTEEIIINELYDDGKHDSDHIGVRLDMQDFNYYNRKWDAYGIVSSYGDETMNEYHHMLLNGYYIFINEGLKKKEEDVIVKLNRSSDTKHK